MAKGKHAKKRAKRPVKEPLSRKDGAVAKRAAKPERLALKEIRNKKKPRQGGAVPLYGCRRPLRIKRNGSRKRKRDADLKAKRQRLQSLLSPDDLLPEDFEIDRAVSLDARDREARFSQDRIRR